MEILGMWGIWLEAQRLNEAFQSDDLQIESNA
jgi:hypothetical protein